MKQSLYIFFVLCMATALCSCGGGNSTVFVHQEYNFAFIERVAIVPFENLSGDQGAGNRVTRLFLNDLLSRDAFDVVEPGEVTKVLQKYTITRAGDLPTDQIISIGRELGVQAIFLGSVNESSDMRSGNSNISIITIITRLVETEKGTTVWSAANTTGGKSTLGSIFGTSDKNKSAETRKCIKNLLDNLIN